MHVNEKLFKELEFLKEVESSTIWLIWEGESDGNVSLAIIILGGIWLMLIDVERHIEKIKHLPIYIGRNFCLGNPLNASPLLIIHVIYVRPTILRKRGIIDSVPDLNSATSPGALVS